MKYIRHIFTLKFSLAIAFSVMVGCSTTADVPDEPKHLDLRKIKQAEKVKKILSPCQKPPSHGSICRSRTARCEVYIPRGDGGYTKCQ